MSRLGSERANFSVKSRKFASDVGNQEISVSKGVVRPQILCIAYVLAKKTLFHGKKTCLFGARHIFIKVSLWCAFRSFSTEPRGWYRPPAIWEKDSTFHWKCGFSVQKQFFVLTSSILRDLQSHTESKWYGSIPTQLFLVPVRLSLIDSGDS